MSSAEKENITDDEDFLELIDILCPIRKSPVFKQRHNYWEELTEKEFFNRFRLPKAVCYSIVDLISDSIKNPTNRNHAVTPAEMLLLTLRFYATGTMMIVVADFIGIDKSTACRIIHRVSEAIANLYRAYIKMPESEVEKREKAIEFYKISRFPQCIGAIDCTHVKLQSQGGEDAEIFRNRKGYFSMNVQAVCDANLNFQNIVCRWPGSSHDSTIFNHSTLSGSFENGEFANYVLVGDSGYPIKKYLITPLTQPSTPAEHLFNESQIRTRNPIERCFGVWKRCFPILSLGLRVKQERCEAIVVSTGILHNIANTLRIPLPDIDEDLQQFIENDLSTINDAIAQVPNVPSEYIVNNSTRLMLIQNHFSRI